MRVVPDYEVGSWTETSDGTIASRTFLVVELAGTASAQIKGAVEAVGVPARGDPHPEDATLVAIQKSGSARDESTVLVTVEYEIPTWRNSPETVSQEITLDASVITDETRFDINGVRISAVYDYPVGPIVTHYPKATRAGSLMTASVWALETTSQADLMLRSVAYIEHVNNAAWFGWPEKSWKLDDLQVRRSRFAGYQEVTYVLTYNPRTWRFVASFIDSGTVPPDATEGNGFSTWDIRELADFSLLPITMPTLPP